LRQKARRGANRAGMLSVAGSAELCPQHSLGGIGDIAPYLRREFVPWMFGQLGALTKNRDCVTAVLIDCLASRLPNEFSIIVLHVPMNSGKTGGSGPAIAAP
jgi:hypothetical protein